MSPPSILKSECGFVITRPSCTMAIMVVPVVFLRWSSMSVFPARKLPGSMKKVSMTVFSSMVVRRVICSPAIEGFLNIAYPSCLMRSIWFCMMLPGIL